MRVLSISKDKLRCIRYDLWLAGMKHHINKHPQIQMKELGIKLIRAIPESISDCWICLTDYQDELPGYIDELELKPHDSYWLNWDLDIVE